MMRKTAQISIQLFLACLVSLSPFVDTQHDRFQQQATTVKPYFSDVSNDELKQKELFSTAFYSDDSFFYGDDEYADRYELYLKASYQSSSGKKMAADDTSKKLMAMEPHDAAYDVRVKFLFEAGKFEKLIKLTIFSSEKRSTSNWETLLLGARAFDATGNHENADELFDYLLKKYPDKDQIVYFDVLRLLKCGAQQGAIVRIDNFLKSATLKARHAIFYQLKASIFMQPPDAKPQMALEMINKSVELNPRSFKGWMTKVVLHDRLGQAEESIATLRSLLNMTDDISLRKALVEKLFRGSMFVEAAKELEKILEKTPEHYFDLALLYWKSGNVKIAEKNINLALSLDKKFKKARLLRLEILLSKKEPVLALNDVKGWIEEDPNNPIPLKGLLSLSGYGVKRSVLIDTLKKLNKTHPKSRIILGALADLNLAEENYHGALKYYQKLLTLLKSDRVMKMKTLYQIAYAQYLQGDVSSAIRQLEAVLKKDSNFASAGNLLAYLYAEKGENLEKALKLIETALLSNPVNTAFLDTKVVVLVKLKRRRDALLILKKALQLDPLNISLRTRCAQLKAMVLTASANP